MKYDVKLAYAQNLGAYYADSVLTKLKAMPFSEAHSRLRVIISNGSKDPELKKHIIEDLFLFNGMRPLWTVVSANYVPDCILNIQTLAESIGTDLKPMQIVELCNVFAELTGFYCESIVLSMETNARFDRIKPLPVAAPIYQMLGFHKIDSKLIYDEKLVREFFCKTLVSRAEQLLK